jgi:hypothetical protein
MIWQLVGKLAINFDFTVEKLTGLRSLTAKTKNRPQIFLDQPLTGDKHGSGI